MKKVKKWSWDWWPEHNVTDVYHHWSFISLALLMYAWFAPEKFGHWIGMIFEGIQH